MHEYGIACGIVDTVRDIAKQNNAKKILHGERIYT